MLAAACLLSACNTNAGLAREHAADVKQWNDAQTAGRKAEEEQCKADYAVPALDPIRHKVELYRGSDNAAPPFEIASNDTFPTNAERGVIAKWASLRDECVRRSKALLTMPPAATNMQVAFIQQQRSFFLESGARVGELIVVLYQQKLTYGEFAHKRYEITRDAAAAELAFRQSTLDRDQQRQMQAQQLAQQQFANNLAAWSVYMQSVNARQPQTVHIDGTIRVQ
jgi:hypothetical protein